MNKRMNLVRKSPLNLPPIPVNNPEVVLYSFETAHELIQISRFIVETRAKLEERHQRAEIHFQASNQILAGFHQLNVADSPEICRAYQLQYLETLRKVIA